MAAAQSSSTLMPGIDSATTRIAALIAAASGCCFSGGQACTRLAQLTIPATLPSRRTAPRSMLAAREQGVYGWFALGERTDPHGHEIHPPPPVMLAVAISKAPVRREVLQPPTNHALARCQSRCAGSIHRYGRGTQVTAWPQGVSGRPERSW
jgi:hypothetical protein